MREFNGFIEFSTHAGELYHEKAIALNSAKNHPIYLVVINKKD